MITRYQHNAALYADVLENPLILQNIFQHLQANDTLNIVITNASFTKEERFQDILSGFLKEKKQDYDKKMLRKMKIDCVKNMHSFLDTFQTMQQVGSSNNQLLKQLYRMYDYLIENKWFIEQTLKFAKIIEKKILDYLHFDEFLETNLNYLKLLFDIDQQFETNDIGNEIRFIITTSGEKVFC
tara:strand:- start:33 stop:581 length:549 start_codon:yes stop_codon:yes gene_type:complete